MSRAQQMIATGVLAAACGFAGSTVGLIVFHDQFQGEPGRTGPAGETGPTGPVGPEGSQGPPGIGLDALNGAYVVGSRFGPCPPGATGPSFGNGVVTGVGLGGFTSGPLYRDDLETQRLCLIDLP